MAQERVISATKTARFHQFMDSCLQEDIDNLRGFPLKETSINLGLGSLMLIMAALHFLLTICQFAYSLLAAGAELMVKGLTRVMPAPKIKEAK